MNDCGDEEAAVAGWLQRQRMLNSDLVMDDPLLGRPETLRVSLALDEARIELTYATMEFFRIAPGVAARLGRNTIFYYLLGDGGPRPPQPCNLDEAERLYPLAVRWLNRMHELLPAINDLNAKLCEVSTEAFRQAHGSGSIFEGCKPVLWQMVLEKEALNDLRAALENIERAWRHSWETPQEMRTCHSLYRMTRRSWGKCREKFERKWLRRPSDALLQ